MRKHIPLLSILPVSFLLTAGCGDYLDLEPDDPPPPDAAQPDADPGPGYPPLPPPQAFPEQPVVTAPGEAPPPPGDVGEGVHLVFPPPVSLTTARHVTVRGTARLAGGVTEVRINGVDARLSSPNAQGGVAWQADVQVALGVSELVVRAVGGSGDAAPAATASITFSPDMQLRPGTMALDVGHDRLLVSDRLQGLVAIDLATGTPTRVRLQETADGPLFPYSLSIDAATGRALALFEQQSCADDLRQEVTGVASIDLRDGATVVAEEFDRFSDCESAGESGYELERSVVLLAGSESFFYTASWCEEFGDCHAEIRRRRLGGAEPVPVDVPLCTNVRCAASEMLADPAGAGLLALVFQRTSEGDESFEVRAIDPVAGAETRVIPVQTVWDDKAFRPWSMVLDAAGNRLLVLAHRVSENVESNRLSVIGVELATGAQSLLFADIAAVDGTEFWAIADAVHDPRRDRLILSDETRGLIALDLATGATSLLLRPSIGSGPALPCTFNRACVISNLDPVRQRFFVHLPSSGADGEIYTVDLATGARSLLSPRDSILLDGTSRLLADAPEDRLLVVHENRSLYSVDGSTGERTYLGTVPPFLERGAMAWDPAQNRMLYYAEQDGHALRAFHVDTREDRVISSDTVGSGPSLLPSDEFPPREDGVLVTLDASGARAFVSQIYARRLFRVDLATGDRTSLTVNEPEARPAEQTWPQPVVADTRRNRLLVGEFPRNAISAIDLATGVTSTFVDDYRADLPIRYALDVLPDHADDRALVRSDHGDVHMLDLQTGERVLILQSSRSAADPE